MNAVYALPRTSYAISRAGIAARNDGLHAEGMAAHHVDRSDAVRVCRVAASEATSVRVRVITS
nr:hypothetical protein OG999_13830 [Streptomyces sp. NBC_00886]